MIRALLFDLDNTLVDSRLDFDAMRREMGLPDGAPILESIDRLDAVRAEWCRQVLDQHELAGALRATLLPGVAELLAAIGRRGWKFGIATRNSLRIARATLSSVGIACDVVLTRDCGPVKPDPWPVQFACRTWNVPPAEVVVVGDYKFDIQSGRAAGARTVLLTHDGNPAAYPNDERADLVLSSLASYAQLLAWIERL